MYCQFRFWSLSLATHSFLCNLSLCPLLEDRIARGWGGQLSTLHLLEQPEPVLSRIIRHVRLFNHFLEFKHFLKTEYMRYLVYFDYSWQHWPEQRGGLPDPAELDAECLHLDIELPDIDYLVSDQGLEEHAYQPYQPVLHVSRTKNKLVLECFTQTL